MTFSPTGKSSGEWGSTSPQPPRTVSDHELRQILEKKRNISNEQANQGDDLHPSSRVSSRIDALSQHSGVCGCRATTRPEDVEADWLLHSKYDNEKRLRFTTIITNAGTG